MPGDYDGDTDVAMLPPHGVWFVIGPEATTLHSAA